MDAGNRARYPEKGDRYETRKTAPPDDHWLRVVCIRYVGTGNKQRYHAGLSHLH